MSTRTCIGHKLTRYVTRFINNEFVKGVDGKTFETINPSTEKVICSVHEANEKDVDVAVRAARDAFNGPWKTTTPEQRGKYLVKLSELLERDADILASLESLDNGKAKSIALSADVPMAYGCLRYYGGWADKITGQVVDVNPETFSYTKQEPVSHPLSLAHAITYTTAMRTPLDSSNLVLYACVHC